MTNRIWLIVLLSLFIFGCGNPPTPKPLGYYRIDFPEKEYIAYQGGCKFSFEYPLRSLLDTNMPGKPACWMNLHYPQYAATIHLTYSRIGEKPLNQFIEDSRKMAMKHVVKADAIDEFLINNKEERVYGISYDFGGNTATSFQFFVTDSVEHFIRGSMYFNLPPNPDSLEPVNSFIKQDIHHLINSLRWQE